MEAVSSQKNMNGKPEGMMQQSKPMGINQAENSYSMNEEVENGSLFKKSWFWVALGAGILILAFIIWFFLS